MAIDDVARAIHGCLMPLDATWSTLLCRLDILLEMNPGSSELGGKLFFNQALFNEDTIQRMSRHLVVLLSSIVQQPQARLSELVFIDDHERHHVSRKNLLSAVNFLLMFLWTCNARCCLRLTWGFADDVLKIRMLFGPLEDLVQEQPGSCKQSPLSQWFYYVPAYTYKEAL